jgi:2-iminobutanoate/2-iminopropanoate deaminase
MNKKSINTNNAPKPVGPYSQAVKAGNFLFVSGQGPIDPLTRKIVSDNIEQQAIRTLENIKAILNSEGLDFKDVVKVSVFLKDIKNFSKMNDIYSRYFQSDPPARTTIQAVPPADIEIEIDVVAFYKD